MASWPTARGLPGAITSASGAYIAIIVSTSPVLNAGMNTAHVGLGLLLDGGAIGRLRAATGEREQSGRRERGCFPVSSS